MAKVPIRKIIPELQMLHCSAFSCDRKDVTPEMLCGMSVHVCRLFGSCCVLLRQPIPHPSGLISQDQDDSQIYEVILTIVCVKQIIGRDEWAALAMKLHQP